MFALKSRKVAGEIAAVVRELANRTFVSEVVLFGSRARGDYRPDSDADLLLVLNRANKADQKWLYTMQEEHNEPDQVRIHFLGIERSQINRRLRAGNIILYDALVEGVSLYPKMGVAPRQQSDASRFSMDAAASQWLTVVEDSIASAQQGHERLPMSDPLAHYFHGYMPARVHGLAVAAVRSAMWTAFYLRGERPDRIMALDTMASHLGWAMQPLGNLFVDLADDDEPNARHMTRVAAGYVELVRTLAAERRVSAKRLGYRSIAAYRLILEKYPSRMDNPAQAIPDATMAVLKSSQ